MPEPRTHRVTRRDIPGLRSRRRTGHDRLAIRAEGDGVDLSVMHDSLSESPAGYGVPEPDPLIVSSRSQDLSIGTERHPEGKIRVFEPWANLPPSRHIPESSGVVPARGRDGLTIRAEGH